MYPEIPSPCFVLEEEKLMANLKTLRKVIDEAGVEILVALKGYSFWKTFPLIRQYLSGACASSLNEARLIYEEMGLKAHTYCPVFFDSEWDEISSISSHLTFNSISQWEKFKNKIPAGTTCALRVNPGYSEIETDLYNPARPGSRLGIVAEQMPQQLPDGIEGLHFHVLCEQDSYVLERVLEKVENQFSHLLRQAKWLNMGGGHHITRADYDVNHLISLLKNFQARYPNLKIILEPGEAVGWQTGFLLSTVEDIVENQGVKVAMLDVSFAAHMPDCLEMPYKPTIRFASEPEIGKATYRMGGLTCLAGDFFGDYSFDRELEAGDRLIFEDMIHYTMVKTTLFNGVKHPHIGMIERDGKFHLLRSVGYKQYRERLS